MQHIERDGLSFEILGEDKVTRKSFSGHKGAKAVLYNIKSSFGIFFGIFPNFIHSQVFELDEQGQPRPRRLDIRDVDPNLFGTEIKDGRKHFDTESSLLETRLQKIKDINEQIIEYQEELMKLHHSKNKILEDINICINEEIELDFEERVVLRSLIVYGFNDITHIAELLNKTEEGIQIIIKRLKRKGWITDKKIIKIGESTKSR
jgi:predicted transcriptional regulator